MRRQTGRAAAVVVSSGALVLAFAGAALAASRPSDGSGGAVTALAGVPPRAPTQVAVFDRQQGTTTIISRDESNAPGSASSSRPSISGDGLFIAFQSDAALRAGDNDGASDVYLWDGTIGGVQLVSQRPGGGGSNGESRNPSISADASIVAFASTSTGLTSDQGLGGNQVFAWQRLTGAVSLVSVAAAGGGAASGSSGDPSISADGRVVAFESTGDDLVEGDTNDVRDVFLRDLARGATIRASSANDGRQPGAESRRASVSGDGGSVIFDSTAGILAPGDTNKARDVFLRDLPPAVTVSPNPVDYGVVSLGTPATQSVIALSYGWTPVEMQPANLSGVNAGDFVIAGDGCQGLVLPAGASCSIAVLYIPTEAGPRTATLEVNDTALDSPQVVELKGGVPAPLLRLDPAVGPPGIVTILTATNLPPGAIVTVEWDRGLTQQTVEPFVVGEDGVATIQVLVFHKDVLGPRNLIVTPGAGGPSFTVGPVPFLVVAPQLQPPGNASALFGDPDRGPTPISR